MACGAENLGTSLTNSLVQDVPYDTPDIDVNGTGFAVPNNLALKATVLKLVNEDLTTRVVGGDGTFDALMAGFSAHLLEEYNKNRITGAEYTKAYAALSEAAMAQGSAFLVARDKQYWDNLISQQQAQLAEVQIAASRIKFETAKVEHSLAQLQALNLRAQYASTKMDIALKSSQFCISEYNLNEIMPIQRKLLAEQYEAALAQTSDTKSDGSPVVGNLGMQKALHAEQIVAYRNESQVKVAKLYTDAFITQFTINDEINVPVEFRELSVNSTIAALKANVGLPPSPEDGTTGGGGTTPAPNTNTTVVLGMTDAGVISGTGTSGTVVTIARSDGAESGVAAIGTDGTFTMQFPVPHDYSAVPQLTYSVTTKSGGAGGAVLGDVITFTPTQGYVEPAPVVVDPVAPGSDASGTIVLGMAPDGTIYGTSTAGYIIYISDSASAGNVTTTVNPDGTFGVIYPIAHDYGATVPVTYLINTSSAVGVYLGQTSFAPVDPNATP